MRYMIILFFAFNLFAATIETEFGEGSGADYTGNHKVTWISDFAGIEEDAFAGEIECRTRDFNSTAAMGCILRFDLRGVSIDTSLIDSVKLFMIINAPILDALDSVPIIAFRMLTAWGIDDTTEGSSEGPATALQATWDNAFDGNGTGDVAWAGGGVFSSSDYESASPMDSALSHGNQSVGDELEWRVDRYAKLAIVNNDSNYGILLADDGTDTASQTWFDSDDNATAANRPRLVLYRTVGTVDRFVNTAATLGGDGTTNDTTGANRAYHSLFEWEVNEQTDLILEGVDHIVHCEGTAADDSTVLVINGWTTAVTTGITIQVDLAVRHSGIFSTSHYRVEGPGTFGEDVITINETDVKIIGLQIQMTSGGAASSGIMANATGASIRLEISNVIVKGNSIGSALSLRSSSKVDNTLCYDASVCFDIKEGDDRVYNSTAYGCGEGFNSPASGGSDVCKNCLSDNNSNADFAEAGTGTLTLTNCASEDGTADDFLGSGNRVLQTFTYVDEVGDDFHLARTDAGALDFGVDLSGDADLPIIFDVDRERRNIVHQAAYDIGFDEYMPDNITDLTVTDKGPDTLVLTWTNATDGNDDSIGFYLSLTAFPGDTSASQGTLNIKVKDDVTTAILTGLPNETKQSISAFVFDVDGLPGDTLVAAQDTGSTEAAVVVVVGREFGYDRPIFFNGSTDTLFHFNRRKKFDNQVRFD